MDRKSWIVSCVLVCFVVNGYGYQGQAVSSDDAIKRAKDYSEADTKPCGFWSKGISTDDADYFIEQHKLIQQATAQSIEKFTSNRISRAEAVREMNLLIKRSNELNEWGKGKVTGVCGAKPVTQKIGKSADATSLLFVRYKGVLQVK